MNKSNELYTCESLTSKFHDFLQAIEDEGNRLGKKKEDMSTKEIYQSLDNTVSKEWKNLEKIGVDKTIIDIVGKYIPFVTCILSDEVENQDIFNTICQILFNIGSKMMDQEIEIILLKQILKLEEKKND
jgi:hypothetical protein